jgi:rfaE bifunctional protein kinase chain/domain
MISPDRVSDLLDRVRNVQVAVYGDFALDAYWVLDPRGSERSVETGLEAQAVREHYYTLGGAANVVANMMALRPASVLAIGAIGDDIFGRELGRQLDGLGVDTSGLVVQKKDFDTITFAKRYLEGEEQPRIDFGFYNERAAETERRILGDLEGALRTRDGLVFNQQVPGSLSSEQFIESTKGLFQRYDDRIVLLDSRHSGDRFEAVCRKTNAVEAARLNGVEAEDEEGIDLREVRRYASALHAVSGRPVFVTRGRHGMVVADSEGLHEIPGVERTGKVDTVGAGDTCTSALTLSLAAGASPVEAAHLASLAAAVTVKKLCRTGTASREELLDIAESHRS